MSVTLVVGALLVLGIVTGAFRGYLTAPGPHRVVRFVVTTVPILIGLWAALRLDETARWGILGLVVGWGFGALAALIPAVRRRLSRLGRGGTPQR